MSDLEDGSDDGVEFEEPNDDGSSGSDDGGSDSQMSDNGPSDDKVDGFADMMTKILNQKIPGKVAVLAKRKTQIMKDIEGDKGDKERLKRLRMERKAQREKQLVVPDQTSADYERQLRKLATRGGELCPIYVHL